MRALEVGEAEAAGYVSWRGAGSALVADQQPGDRGHLGTGEDVVEHRRRRPGTDAGIAIAR